jgi:hypothetical protein
MIRTARRRTPGHRRLVRFRGGAGSGNSAAVGVVTNMDGLAWLADPRLGEASSMICEGRQNHAARGAGHRVAREAGNHAGQEKDDP